MNLFVSHGTGEDVVRFVQMAKAGTEELWTANPHAKFGDRIIIYVKSPYSACFALATISGKRWVDGEKHGWPGYQMIKVRIDKAINPPVPLKALQKTFPNWGWPKMPQSQVHVPEEYVEPLLELLKASRASEAEEFEETIAAKVAGGGFGSAEENQRVEQAAIDHVRRHFEKDGWSIQDRQRDRCGYDLHVARDGEELHLEVKGTRATEPGFILTANELACADSDPAFRLCVVTDALTKRATSRMSTADEMRAQFTLSPIAYLGRAK
jgi:hypothetical protein